MSKFIHVAVTPDISPNMEDYNSFQNLLDYMGRGYVIKSVVVVDTTIHYVLQAPEEADE